MPGRRPPDGSFTEGEADVLNTDVKGSSPHVVWSETISEHGAVVVVDGDLDLETAHQLEAHLARRIAAGHRHLVVDLTTATFLDSTAMRTLVTTIAPLRDEPDAAVVLAGANGVVERALSVSGIGALFAAYDTRDDAIVGLNDAAEPLRAGWRAVGRRSPA
jgi:stage II sporulation protein AA (anti-sigma F factor antagonist)